MPVHAGPASAGDVLRSSAFLPLTSGFRQRCARRDAGCQFQRQGPAVQGRVSVSGGRMMSLGGNLPKTVSHPPLLRPSSTGTHSSWFVLERGHILLTSSSPKQLRLWVFPPLLCCVLFPSSRNDRNPSPQQSGKTQQPKKVLSFV